MVSKVTSMMSRLASRDEGDPNAATGEGAPSEEAAPEAEIGLIERIRGLQFVHAVTGVLFVLTVMLAIIRPHPVELVLFMVPAIMSGRLGLRKALDLTAITLALATGVYFVTEQSLTGSNGGVTLIALLTLIVLSGVGSP